ncbi:MAG: GTPase Der [Elusimicrobia bacterium]|nr:GTPase Der [Elusimicrobiota bacterium]
MPTESISSSPNTPKIPPPRKRKTAAIVGHPNVGKSVIFHALTGKYVTVSNFPGTTVDLSQGVGKINENEWDITDTPGVLSLLAKTEDERVARDFLIKCQPDVVIQVADAKNLSKALHLTLELSEFNLPMVLVLNMSDEREDRGLHIDVPRLSKILGVPVIETVAVDGEGIPALKSALTQATLPCISPQYDAALTTALERVEKQMITPGSNSRAKAVYELTRNKAAHTQFARPVEVLFFEGKQKVVQEAVGEVLSLQKPGETSWLGKLGNWSMRPFPGYLFAAFTLFALYEFVGVFGAGTLVGFLEENIFGGWINPAVTAVVTKLISFTWIQDFLIGEYGVITMALTYAFALILPIVTTFFLFFGLLEDSGYLPRLAVMMDRFFRLMGLNGRAVLPMVLGLGCDTMATVTTRILDTKREKFILSLLLTLSVPCSAQLGAVMGMAAGQSWKVLLVWFVVLAITMLLVGWGAAKLLPGARSPFLMELPPLRIPKISNIFKKVKARLKWYTKEVIPLFILATSILFVLDKLKILEKLESFVAPLVVSFLGLPAKASEAFLIGFLRRDYGAAGFFKMAQAGLLDTRQITVSMVVITLFMPCVAHLLITIKERGIKAASAITLFVMTFALSVGGLLNWVLKWSQLLS